MKPLTSIACVAIIAALVVGACGCTTTTNNTSTSPPSSTHDALLEKFLNATKQEEYGNASNKIQAWDVTWNNGTSVILLETAKENSAGLNLTVSANETIISFPTTQDATNYLNAFDKANYSLKSTDYTSDPIASHIYYNTTGHYPSVYKEYSSTEGSILNGSAKVHEFTQEDNIFQMLTATISF